MSKVKEVNDSLAEVLLKALEGTEVESKVVGIKTWEPPSDRVFKAALDFLKHHEYREADPTNLAEIAKRAGVEAPTKPAVPFPVGG